MATTMAARPETHVPAHPADIQVDDVIDYAERAVKWLMERSMEDTATDKAVAAARQIETRNVAELQRTLERLSRLKRQRATDRIATKTDEQLGKAVIKALRKVSKRGAAP